MKVHTIEIAEAIERELRQFLKEWGSGYPMKFMRFVDLGGKQTDLYVYSAEKGTSPWMVIRIKSVMKSEQGECIQVFVNVVGKPNVMEEVVVSPEVWKLPALADRILKFAKNDMLLLISEGSGAIDGDESDSLEAGEAESRADVAGDDDDEEYEDLDTAGILAGDGDEGASDFDPEDVLAQAANEDDEEEQVADPSDLIRQLNDEADETDEADDEEERRD